MDQIDPTSLALLSVLAATAVVIAIHAVLTRISTRREARRWARRDDEIIDLTFLHSAIERDREVGRSVDAGRR